MLKHLSESHTNQDNVKVRIIILELYNQINILVLKDENLLYISPLLINASQTL